MSNEYEYWDGRHQVQEADPTITEPIEPVAAELPDELGDPFADDLSEQLAAKAPNRYTNRYTAIFVGLVLLVGGFVAGAQVQKHFGAKPASTPFVVPSNFRNGGGFGAAGGGVGGAGAGGGTTGKITLVDGSTVYVTTSDGSVVIVHTNADTTITTAGTAKDLTTGSTVTVSGQAGSDGSVTATRIVKSAG